MSAIRKNHKNKKALFGLVYFTQSLGKITILLLKKVFTFFAPLLVVVLRIFDLIGRTTIVFGQVIGRFLSFYLRQVVKLLSRLLLFVQFIGEATLLAGFVVGVTVRAILISLKILEKPSRKPAFIKLHKAAKRRLAKINFSAILRDLYTHLSHIEVKPPPRYLYVTASIIFVLWGTYYFCFFKNLPSPYDLARKPLPTSSLVLDRSGKLLFIAYNGEVNRIPISLDKIPETVIEATIAVEDQNFYHHAGISPKGIVRALVNNITDKPTQGGSTITQQLVKIALLKDNRRIVSRKVKEAYLSLLVEKAYSKEKILEMYLNNAPYGGTAYGIEAAARKYFGKEAASLTLSEGALLASLPTAPTLYSPYFSGEQIYKNNQKRALENMMLKKFITKKQADEAYSEKLTFYAIDNQIMAAHFVFWVLDQLEQTFGKKLVLEGGLRVTTTLDLPTQLKAEQIVKENVEKLEKPYWIGNAAALVTQPQTGRILAMVGSRDYFDEKHDGNVNVTLSRRQPGSSIKVVNYAYALSQGGFTPSSVIVDSPVSYSNAWETYTPRNYDGKFRGAVTLKQALAMSLNVPAVKVLNTYGPDKMRELGIKMGIESWKDLKNYGLSLTLGAGDVKMTELATVYGILPNLGKRKDLYAIEKIVTPDGKILADSKNPQKKGVLGVAVAQAAEEKEVIPQYTAYQLTSILSDNAARMPAFGPYAKLEIPGHRVAVKTGTTNDIRDNWTIGYTPDVLVATWVGNNDNSPMNPHLTSGITGAAPIWNEIMSNLLEGKPAEQFATPSGMLKVKICAVNGLLTCPRCPKETEEFFAPGQEPKTKCYFPTTQECEAKKKQLEEEKKSPDEINKALVNCPAGSTN